MDTEQQLPPHAPEAEAAVLGSLLTESYKFTERMAVVISRLTQPEVFYDLRHRTVFLALQGIHSEGRPADVTLLRQRLHDTGRLEEVGGASFVSELADLGNPALLDHYVAIVAEKFAARQAISMAANWEAAIRPSGSLSESQLERMRADVEALATQSRCHLLTEPKNIARAVDFDEKIRQTWTEGTKRKEPGWKLPFNVAFHLRSHESTLFTGESGSGKSSVLGQMAVVMAKEHGVRTFIASFEMPPWITYWIMMRQVLGTNRLDFTKAEDEERYQAALAFVQKYIYVYDFQGIGNWQVLLDTFQWVRREMDIEVFIVDSVMRIGIMDDDYTTQGMVAARYTTFATQTGAHVVLVVHQNKSSDSSAKTRVRGTAQWTDNVCNVAGMKRNSAKAEKIEAWKEEVRTGEMPETEFRSKVDGMRLQWDAKFEWHKQRYPGSVQNGSRYLYFDQPSLQFLENVNDRPSCFV
jgi:replicative DNA helicase